MPKERLNFLTTKTNNSPEPGGCELLHLRLTAEGF